VAWTPSGSIPATAARPCAAGSLPSGRLAAEGGPLLVYTGRLAPEKRPELAVAALEALASGTPVVAARTGALPELLGAEWFVRRR